MHSSGVSELAVAKIYIDVLDWWGLPGWLVNKLSSKIVVRWITLVYLENVG